MAKLKQAGAVAWLAGIAVCIGLTIWSGPAAVGHAVISVGWGLLLIVLVRAVTVVAAGAGWWLLFPAKMRPRLRTCVLLRFIREAGNVLLMQVGGDLVGARLLTARGISGPLAGASIVVDVLVAAVTQLLFAMVGLIALIALEADPTLVRIVAGALAVAALMLVGFYLVQHRGGQRIFRWGIGLVTGAQSWRALGTVDAVYQNLALIYSDRSRTIGSGLLHLASWIIGVAEVSIALALMGHPVGIAEALVIESLLHAIRGAAFTVPAALGAQEAGLVMLCGLFGIAPEQAIALSLVKRAADLLLGLPGLLAWQAAEWRQMKGSVTLRAVVMPALGAGIHVLKEVQNVDGRDKPGHDAHQ